MNSTTQTSARLADGPQSRRKQSFIIPKTGANDSAVPADENATSSQACMPASTIISISNAISSTARLAWNAAQPHWLSGAKSRASRRAQIQNRIGWRAVRIRLTALRLNCSHPSPFDHFPKADAGPSASTAIATGVGRRGADERRDRGAERLLHLPPRRYVFGDRMTFLFMSALMVSPSGLGRLTALTRACARQTLLRAPTVPLRLPFQASG